MRPLQIVLTVLGLICLCTWAGFVTVVVGLAVLNPQPGAEPWTKAMGQLLGGMICGLPLGAIVGIVVSIIWIKQCANQPLWNRWHYMGILVGTLLGVFANYWFRVSADLLVFRTGTIVSTAVMGGLIASFAYRIGSTQTTAEDTY